MRSFSFPDEILASIRHDRYHHPHPRVQRKMEVLWLKSCGLPHAEIARLADVSLRTVQRNLDDYLNGGLELTRRLDWKGPTCKLEDHRVSIEDHFVVQPPRTAREAAETIHRLTGIRRGVSQVRAYLKRIGMSWRKAGTIPAKCDPDVQDDFLTQKLEPRLEEAKTGKRTVFFVDAAHFIFGPFLCMLWCFVRYFVPGPCGRKRYNVLGALNAVTHELIRVTNHSYINAESVCELLRKVAAAVPGPVTLVLDNARYQKCALVQNLAATLGIELLYLPSYSPNLNLIERLWKYMKKECLGCRVLPTYDEFTAAIDDRLDNLSTEGKAEMDTLLTLNFQRFDDVPVLAA